MRTTWFFVLAVACAGSPDARVVTMDTEGADAPARSGLFHALEGVMVPGVTANVLVGGAVPGETIYLVRSFTGEGPGICPAPIGGACMDILSPIAIMATGMATADGTARIAFDVPPGAPIGASLSTQAVAIRGLGGASSVLSPPRTDVVRSAVQTVEAPTLVEFGTVPTGCDPAVFVEIGNSGLAPLEISGVRMTTPEFRVTGPPLPVTVEFGETVEVMVQADVRGGIPYAGDLIIESDDPAGDAVVALFVYGDDASDDCDDTVDAEVTAAWRSVDLTLLLDTTSSMGATADAVSEQFPGIATDLSASLSDLTFGVATYEDYNFGSFGSGDDKPFRLQTVQTSDRDQAQEGLDSIELHYGADLPESTLEALFQVFTGLGYDQDCDGRYDAADDVRPLVSTPEDAFGGAVAGDGMDAPGVGPLGGIGLREGSIHIVAYATDAVFRDPSAGDDAPGGCSTDAGSVEVTEAISALDGLLIGIDSSPTGAPRAQMGVLAEATGSVTDIDGDGIEEAAVIAFSDPEALRSDLVAHVLALLPAEADFEGTLELVVVDDPARLVSAIEPAAVEGAAYGEPLPFTVVADGVWLGRDGPGASRVELALLHDGARLDGLYLYGVPPID